MRILYKEEDSYLVQEVHTVESDGSEHILLHGSVGMRFDTKEDTQELLHKLLEKGYVDLSAYSYSLIYENSYF